MITNKLPTTKSQLKRKLSVPKKRAKTKSKCVGILHEGLYFTKYMTSKACNRSVTYIACILRTTAGSIHYLLLI